MSCLAKTNWFTRGANTPLIAEDMFCRIPLNVAPMLYTATALELTIAPSSTLSVDQYSRYAMVLIKTNAVNLKISFKRKNGRFLNLGCIFRLDLQKAMFVNKNESWITVLTIAIPTEAYPAYRTTRLKIGVATVLSISIIRLKI